jgi:hypothetical protein
MNRNQLTLWLAGAVLALAGCGGGTGEVSGVVKYQGKPLPQGTITFHDAGKGVQSASIKDGAYTVPGVRTGAAKITVVTPLPLTGMGLQPKTTPGSQVPEKYGDPEKSGLKCEVQGGSQTHNVDLD